jgi:hypothetical protein
MAESKVKQGGELLNLYLKLYKEKYGRAPYAFNRFASKWGFEGMLEDLGYDRAVLVINDYITTRRPDHPVSYLLYNYEKMDLHLRRIEEDDAERERVREETRKLVEGS